ncbi:MAG TPA: hypothetical protein VFD58_19580 [Blastocatellia bacterium]|nr:hypothetical protein [Blastocatellia bacterium]
MNHTAPINDRLTDSISASAALTDQTAGPDESRFPGRLLLRISWLAVLLGFAIEGLILLLTGMDRYSGVKPLVASLAQKISWSVLVCLGLAFGKGATKLLAVPLTGLAGLLAAPTAFTVARSLHKAAAEALKLAPAAATPSPLTLALVKGIEYGLLGLAVGWIGSRSLSRGRSAAAHLATGLAVGAVFGGTMLLVASSGAPQPRDTVALLSLGVNEIIHPVGCAMALFAAEALSQKNVAMTK